jgi:hypothetical protein
MTYDVPVKQFAFHLVLMSVFLIAPDAQRLVRFLVLNQSVAPYSPPRFGLGVRSRRNWFIAQLVFAIWALGFQT